MLLVQFCPADGSPRHLEMSTGELLVPQIWLHQSAKTQVTNSHARRQEELLNYTVRMSRLGCVAGTAMIGRDLSRLQSRIAYPTLQRRTR